MTSRDITHHGRRTVLLYTTDDKSCDITGNDLWCGTDAVSHSATSALPVITRRASCWLWQDILHSGYSQAQVWLFQRVPVLLSVLWKQDAVSQYRRLVARMVSKCVLLSERMNWLAFMSPGLFLDDYSRQSIRFYVDTSVFCRQTRLSRCRR